MRFERLMALRYLKGAQGQSEGRGFLRFITYVAIGGVAVGVAALLLSLSIVRGFSREIQQKIIGFGAHIQVESFHSAPLKNAASVQRKLEQFTQVRSVSPVIQDFILLRKTADDIDGVMLWGTDSLPSFLGQSLIAGEPSFGADVAGRPGMVIGEELAQVLHVEVGDVVTAFSVRSDEGAGEEGSSGGRPRVAQFHITGIYETSLQNFDELYVFTDIAEARELLLFDANEVSRFDVTLHNLEDAEAIADAIEEDVGFPAMARTVHEVARGLFAWVNLQQNIIPLVIGVIIVVAAFNILGMLLMVIMEKTREIGVLASMGASPRTLRRLFLWLGMFIGIIGTTLGMTIALGLALLQQRYKIIPLPEEAYYMKWAPIELNPLDFIIVAVVAFILCALSSYIPARVASRLDPIRVIRFR